jgi:uncharacterized lipoprotein
MMRLALLSLAAALLAGCSSSSRVEGVVPGWANTHTGTVEPSSNRAAVRAAPQAATQPQAAAKPQAPPGEE